MLNRKRDNSLDIIRSNYIKYYQKKSTIKRLFYSPIPIDPDYIHLAITKAENYQNKINDFQKKYKPHSNTLSYDESRDTYTHLYGEEENTIQLGEIFNLCNESSKKILITGTAGIGKSTLTELMLYEWSHKKWGEQYEWIFRINLRNLTKEKYPNDPNYKLIDFICSECLKDANINISTEKAKELESRLIKQIDKVLLILDGYDEIAENISEHLVPILKQLLSHQQLILTSRPYNLFGLKWRYEFDENLKLELIGFTPANIEKYLTTFFNDPETSKSDDIQPISHIYTPLE